MFELGGSSFQVRVTSPTTAPHRRDGSSRSQDDGRQRSREAGRGATREPKCRQDAVHPADYSRRSSRAGSLRLTDEGLTVLSGDHLPNSRPAPDRVPSRPRLPFPGR